MEQKKVWKSPVEAYISREDVKRIIKRVYIPPHLRKDSVPTGETTKNATSKAS